jgi:RecA/RadA recombinase
MAKKIEEQQNNGSDASKNILNALLKGSKEHHYNNHSNEPTVISSGSLLLDSCVTVKTGNTIRMGGAAELGKTSQSLLFASNYMKAMPKAKTLYVNAEAKFSEELQGRTGLKFVFTPEEWDTGTVFVLMSNVYDLIAQAILTSLKTCHENGEHLCIVIDSVDMLTLAADKEKKITDGKKPAGINYITKELFRKISQEVRAFNALLILITQYSATFNLDPYSKEPPQLMEGNNTHALNHQCTYAFYYRQRIKSSFILEKEKEQPDPSTNKILGVYARVDIKKSATDKSGYMVEIPIKKGRVGNAVWTEKEVTDLVLAYELARKSGAWVTFDSNVVSEAKKSNVEIKEKINGINQLYDYLETDTNALNWLKNKVEEITKLRTQLITQ